MTFPKFTAVSAAVGLVIPFLFLGTWHFLNQYHNLQVGLVAEKIMLLLWPTSFMTLPASTDAGFERKLLLFSLACNVIVYSLIGALIWLALRKHAIFFGVAGLAVIAMWWWLLSTFR